METKEFLEYLRPSSLSKYFGSARKAFDMANRAKPNSVETIYHRESYEGDFSLTSIAEWLSAQAIKHPEAVLNWNDEEEDWCVQWATEREYTEEERKDARKWLEENQAGSAHGHKLKFVKFTAFGGGDGS